MTATPSPRSSASAAGRPVPVSPSGASSEPRRDVPPPAPSMGSAWRPCSPGVPSPRSCASRSATAPEARAAPSAAERWPAARTERPVSTAPRAFAAHRGSIPARDRVVAPTPRSASEREPRREHAVRPPTSVARPAAVISRPATTGPAAPSTRPRAAEAAATRERSASGPRSAAPPPRSAGRSAAARTRAATRRRSSASRSARPRRCSAQRYVLPWRSGVYRRAGHLLRHGRVLLRRGVPAAQRVHPLAG